MSNIVNFRSKQIQRAQLEAQRQEEYRNSDENFLNVMAELEQINAEADAWIAQQERNNLEQDRALARNQGLDEVSTQRFIREQQQLRQQRNARINAKVQAKMRAKYPDWDDI